MKSYINESGTKIIIIAENEEEKKMVEEMMNDNVLLSNIAAEAQVASGVAFIASEDRLISANGAFFLPPFGEEVM